MSILKGNVKMKLFELIEWAWDNNVKDETFSSIKDDRGVSYEVGFSDDGSFYSEDFLIPELVFIVEVDVKDIKISKTFTLFWNGQNLYSEIHEDKSINDILHLGMEIKDNCVETIYTLGDDGTLEIIWTKENGVDSKHFTFV